MPASVNWCAGDRKQRRWQLAWEQVSWKNGDVWEQRRRGIEQRRRLGLVVAGSMSEGWVDGWLEREDDGVGDGSLGSSAQGPWRGAEENRSLVAASMATSR